MNIGLNYFRGLFSDLEHFVWTERRCNRLVWFALILMIIYHLHTTSRIPNEAQEAESPIEKGDETKVVKSLVKEPPQPAAAESQIKLRVKRESGEKQNNVQDGPMKPDHPLFNNKIKHLKLQPKLQSHLKKMESNDDFKLVEPFLLPVVPSTFRLQNMSRQYRTVKGLHGFPQLGLVDNTKPSDLYDDIKAGFHDMLPTMLFVIKALKMNRHMGVIDVGGPLGIYAIIANHLHHKAVVISPLNTTLTHFAVVKPELPYKDSLFCFNNIIGRRRRIIHIDPVVEFDSLYHIIKPSDDKYDMSVAASSIRFTDIQFLAPFKQAILCVDWRGCEFDSLVDIPLLLDKMDIVAFVFDWRRLASLHQFRPLETNAIAEDLVQQLQTRGYEHHLVMKTMKINQFELFESNVVWLKSNNNTNFSEIFLTEPNNKPKVPFDWPKFLES